MNRIASLLSASLLLAAAASPVWGQQVQRPASPPATPTTPATTPSSLPANPAQRARPAGSIPHDGPSTPVRPATPAAQPAVPAPATPMPVRDAQGRIVPGAQPTTTDRARDPATGREFQTAPAPTRPH